MKTYILVLVPHQSKPTVGIYTRQELIDKANQRKPDINYDNAIECATAIEAAQTLAWDCAGYDLWEEDNAITLCTQVPSATRHGDPQRTILAYREARMLGWFDAFSDEESEGASDDCAA